MKYNPATMRPGWEAADAWSIHAGDLIEAFGTAWEVYWLNRGQHQVTVKCRTKIRENIYSKGMCDASFETTLPLGARVVVRRAVDDPETALARKLISATGGPRVSGWDHASWDERATALLAAKIALREVGR